MKRFFLKVATRTCVYYTATVFLLLLLFFAINKDLSDGVMPSALALILPFSFLFAVANVQFREAKFHFSLRLLLHAVLTLGGIFTCLYLPNRDQNAAPGQALVLFLFLFVLYAVIMACVLLFSARKKRVTRDADTYESVYK